MADAVYAADVLYPEYSGDEDIDGLKKYVQSVSDYLFLLREGLGYTLDNLGINNFSPTSIRAIGDVIREPVMVQLTDQEGKLAEFSATLEGLSSTVSEIDGNYVSSTQFTQTSGDFTFRINDGDNNAAVVMDASGLTVYKGNIVIKNRDSSDVFYADENGDLILTGTIQGSSIYGSELITCDASDASTAPHFSIGTYTNTPTIQSFNGDRANGFRAVGSETNPYYGLLIVDDLVDFRTWYDSTTSSVHMGMNNSPLYFGINGASGGIAYDDSANNILHYINVDSTGIDLVGTVRVNGTPI